MKRASLLAFLLLVAVVAAQSEIGQQEDFEDDTVGQDPTASWYTFDRESTGSGGQPSVGVVADGLDSTAKAYRFLSNGGSGGATAWWEFPEEQYTDIEFYLRIDGVPGGDSSQSYLLHFCTEGELRSGAYPCRFNDDTNVIIEYSVQYAEASDVATFKLNGLLSCDSTTIYSEAGGTEHKINIQIDWSAKEFTTFLDDVEVTTSSFCTTTHEAIGHMAFYRAVSNDAPTTIFDQWQLDGGPISVEEGEGDPSEFDSGLIAFAASAGFISQESQLFFALVLIGLATVTTSASSKWVAPGRFKNYLLMGVQTLIAIFCVIAAFLDLWMFLVAFMLGLFAVRGGSEVRNTYHQIREALQRQNEREGDDLGPTQVMEVQVSEREEAVERAFQRLEDQSAATDTGEAAEGPGKAVSDDRGGDP